MQLLDHLAHVFLGPLAFRGQFPSTLLYSEKKIKPSWEPWTDEKISQYAGAGLYDGPTSYGATVDDLEMPEVLSYVIFFPLCKQFPPGTPTILTWRAGKELSCVLVIHPLKSPSGTYLVTADQHLSWVCPGGARQGPNP